MKHRHIITVFCISLPICVILRTIQLLFTIDHTTGFIKQQYTVISMLITVIVCAAIAAVSLLSLSVGVKSKNVNGIKPVAAGGALVAGGMFLYHTVIGFSLISAGGNVLVVMLSLLSALVFVAYGVKNIYEYKMPNIILVVPVVYYVAKLIDVFIGASSLALVTENIFMIFNTCALLWFVFEFASYENGIGDTDAKPKKLFATGMVAVMLCAVTGVPKMFLIITQRVSASADDIATALLNLSVGIFIATYILCNFGGTGQKVVYKHSA